MNSITYDPILVVLSYLISVFGSYTALQLASDIPRAGTWTGLVASVAGAGLALGGGAVWSMHFIAMNAADMGMPRAYYALPTLASLAIGFLTSAIGLFLVGRAEGGAYNLPLGGIVTGLGAAATHYLGMAAMIMQARITYDDVFFYASIAIALAGATVALWLTFKLRGNWSRFGGALVIGIALCAMHYTSMFGVRMQRTNEAVAVSGMPFSTFDLAYSVFGVTALLLAFLLAYAVWKAQRTLSPNL